MDAAEGVTPRDSAVHTDAQATASERGRSPCSAGRLVVVNGGRVHSVTLNVVPTARPHLHKL
jgi:hypothetical protein